MDPNGFDLKAFRTNAAPTTSSNPPFSMLQKPAIPTKPFAFVQTQSRNHAENQSQIPQLSASNRRHVDAPRLKQEGNDRILNFPSIRQQQQTLIPQPPRNEPKHQSHKLRAFKTYEEQEQQQSFAPQHFSSPKPPSQKFSQNQHYAKSSLNLLPERPSSPVPQSRSPSLQIDTEFDADDADFSQLMAKRMRDAKLMKTKLAEQLAATAALEARLAAQTADSEVLASGLKNRISELEAREAAWRSQAEEDLRAARARAEDAEKKLQEASAQVHDIRAAAKNGLEDARNKYAGLQGCLQDLKSEYDASKNAVKNLSEELASIRQSAVDDIKRIESSENITRSAETRALISELQSDRASGQQVIDMLRDKLHHLGAQVVEARERVSELEALREGKFEQVGNRLGGLTEALAQKDSKLEELIAQLMEKEREVERLLAGKLAMELRLKENDERLLDVSKSSQDRERELKSLTDDYKERVCELKSLADEKVALERQLREERSKTASLESLSADFGTLREEKVALEWQLKAEQSKAASLESLSADFSILKEEKIFLECMVKEQSSRISALQAVEGELATVKEETISLRCKDEENQAKVAALARLESALVAAKEEVVALKVELKEDRCKLATLEELQRETALNLQQSNDQARKLDLQLDRLQTERTELESAKEQLRTSLESSQRSVEKLKEEMYALAVRENGLQKESEQLAKRLDKMGGEALIREQELKQVNSNSFALQERIESQALTLKLAKEQSGDLQERLLTSEKVHAAELESSKGKLNVEIAMLREQNASLQAALNQARDDAGTQRANLLGASADYENRLSKQEEMHAKLVQAEERRANMAEKEATDAKLLVESLAQKVDSAKGELDDMKKQLREAASMKDTGVEREVVVLRARLEEVEAENARLQHRARTLHKRSQDGDLSDSEKSFVNSLMQMSQSIHEQDMVAKENELRRRENMITSLQTRIDALESTLARLLKERGKEDGPKSKSMVDLSLWLSSSPHSTNAKQEPTAEASAPAQNAPSGSDPDVPPNRKMGKKSKPSGPRSSPGPQHRGHKTLSAIDADDEIEPLTESEDERLVVSLGKRGRTPTSGLSEQSGRPARRQRTTGTRKADPESRKVDPEKLAMEGVKSKQRKRR